MINHVTPTKRKNSEFRFNISEAYGDTLPSEEKLQLFFLETLVMPFTIHTSFKNYTDRGNVKTITIQVRPFTCGNIEEHTNHSFNHAIIANALKWEFKLDTVVLTSNSNIVI